MLQTSPSWFLTVGKPHYRSYVFCVRLFKWEPVATITAFTLDRVEARIEFRRMGYCMPAGFAACLFATFV